MLSTPPVTGAPAHEIWLASGGKINPARDWGPRLAHTIMPIPGKGSSHWGDYALVPLVGPIIGGILGVLLYQLVFSFAGK
ncbi:aquaporin [Megasphaera cerevisiae]|uniref:aquaporin n=1 Tax=Megasphaera cerevisiae TaxID=39029 RepID=UPI0022A95D00|nr:aquaporin [Megasphaera cerevisiae]